MNELPKELTPELLGLVLDVNIRSLKIVKDTNFIKKFSDEILYVADTGMIITSKLNLDTLTRLMLEYIESKGYIYNLFNSTSVQGYVMIVDEHKVIGKSILDVAVKQLAKMYKQKER